MRKIVIPPDTRKRLDKIATEMYLIGKAVDKSGKWSAEQKVEMNRLMDEKMKISRALAKVVYR